MKISVMCVWYECGTEQEFDDLTPFKCVKCGYDQFELINEEPTLSEAYPDGNFDGAFEHKGDNCPECGKKLTRKDKLACDECGWTDF